VDGIAQTSYSWSGNLANLAESSEINIGSFNFTSGNHTIKVWSSNPNGSSDMNNSNDTLTKAVHAKLVPVIEVNPSSITETITNCDDSLSVPIEIINSGGALLNYQIGAISGGYDSTSVQYYTYSGQNVYHYFSNIPTNIDTMTLVVTINGDYDASSEYIDIYLDGNFYVQCMGQYQGGQSTYTYYITGATLSSIINDGQVTVLYDNSSGVNSGYGTGLNQAQLIASGVNWISLLSSNSGSVNTNDTNFVNLK
jgi:hypothetical protein